MCTSQEPSSLANHLDEHALAEALQYSLRGTLFSNGLSVSPRQVNRIGSDLASAFFAYCGDRDEKAVKAYGIRLAEAGIGPRSILAMTETVYRMCFQQSNPPAELPVIAATYVSALLEGYMIRREELVLQEQERTLQAYFRASAYRKGDAG